MNQVALEVFMESLSVMGYGMLGIFIVISLFYIMIVGLEKAFPEKK